MCESDESSISVVSDHSFQRTTQISRPLLIATAKTPLQNIVSHCTISTNTIWKCTIIK